MSNDIYPDLTSSQYDIKYAQLKVLPSDVRVPSSGGINGIGSIGDDDGSPPGTPNLQEVTDVGNVTTNHIVACNYKATCIPEYANNTAAIAGGLTDGEFYYLPYDPVEDTYHLCIVKEPITPPTDETIWGILVDDGDLIADIDVTGVSDLDIDWGDGNTETITSGTDTASHTYLTGGSYDIHMSGTTPVLKANLLNSKLRTTTVIKGIIGLIDFSNMFDGCSNLEAIPAGIFDNYPGLSSLYRTFNGCAALTSIPTGLFDSLPSISAFSGTFAGCVNILAIPTGLFNVHVFATTFQECFNSCGSLTAIPTGLFDNCNFVTSFNATFSGCTGISVIPTGLFNNNSLVTDFARTFSGTSISAIPAGLFDIHSGVTTFNNTFSFCFSLTTIPTELFDNNPAVTDFSAVFDSCFALTTIPTGLFDNNPDVITFANAFQSTAITTIPTGLFDNNLDVDDFSYCFDLCGGLSAWPANLFDNNTVVTKFIQTYAHNLIISTVAPDLWVTHSSADGTQCFFNDTALSNYASIPPGWK